ncbi:unnamed protein product [Schistosoma mattheei]|uniref:Uncharacterized protein n=1 Tax=Schistosoma mattheei TaxID=31246 RepID=A0A3P8BV90_9TREM|nr:unnamed protein product [Schistosoma mattheei]
MSSLAGAGYRSPSVEKVPSHPPIMDHRLWLLGLTVMAVVCIDHFSLVDTAGKLTRIEPHHLSCPASMHFVVVNPSFVRCLYMLPGDTRVLSYAASLSGSQPPNSRHRPGRSGLHMCSLSVVPFAEAALLPPCPPFVCLCLLPLLSL